jgi:nucleoside 2-deoxyribosyltransferase
MDVYIAGPIFNPTHLRVVGEIKATLEMHGCEVFSPYEASRDIWAGRAPRDCTPEERSRVVDQNIDGLLWADTLVAWTGGHMSTMQNADTGTVWEMGYFKSLTDAKIGVAERRTIAYIDKRDLKQHLNLMLAETIDAAVFGTAQLSQLVNTIIRSDRDNYAWRDAFHPSKLVAHEPDPIA